VHPQSHITGRDAEQETLGALLDAVRAGESRVLVVRGEPGIGKSALLERVPTDGCCVARATGIQTEMELPFAGLHQLCGPHLDRLGRLSEPQRHALNTAFGLSSGPAPDRFLIGLATLSLLTDLAGERPLVCLIDDAQWLDRASVHALAFVARRLHAESIALIFAAREPLEGLPELVLTGLKADDAKALLRRSAGAPLDEQILDRIVAETRGNPLGLLELPHDQLAGGFALPLSERLERSFVRRLERLDPDARRLLLVAAAEPTGDPVIVWHAAGVAAADELDDLCEIGTHVRFRHPLEIGRASCRERV